MGFFSSRSKNNENSDKPLKRGAFSFGKISTRKASRLISQTGLRPHQKEYAKRTLERYDSPVSKGITRKEFDKAMGELSKNQRDPITEKQVDSLKKKFRIK